MTEIFNRREFRERRRELRRAMTESERRLWSRLRARQLDGFKFRRQYGIDAYVVDFYCAQVHLAVEVDGPVHDNPETIEYDKERQQIIESLGIRFLRFTNGQVDNDLESVLAIIRSTLRTLKENTPRLCKR